MDDSYLYPRDSMSSDATMRMSLNSLDSTATSAGGGQAHTNWAFAASTSELDAVAPSKMSAKDPRRSRAKSPPPPPKDKPPRLDSAAVGSTTVAWHPAGNSPLDDPPPLPPQPLRSVSAFHQSHFASTDNLKNASFADGRASAPLPKALDGSQGTAGAVQLRSKPSVCRPGDDRERSHLYEELPWSERELAAAASAAASAAAVGTEGSSMSLDNGIMVKERRRTNPLYGPRMPNDTLPPKPDLGAVQRAGDAAAVRREQRRQCFAFSAAIGAIAAIAIAALVLAIMAPAGRPLEGPSVVYNFTSNTTDLRQQLISLQTAVASLQAKVEHQQLMIDDYASKLNITAQAFSSCKVSVTRVFNEPATEKISDTSLDRIIGVYCIDGTLTTSSSTNSTIDSYWCRCLNGNAGCGMLYSLCPARLF